MLDYREWCRLCGNLDGQIDPDANCLELIQLTYQVIKTKRCYEFYFNFILMLFGCLLFCF